MWDRVPLDCGSEGGCKNVHSDVVVLFVLSVYGFGEQGDVKDAAEAFAVDVRRVWANVSCVYVYPS